MRAISLFTGAGGMDVGFKNAGFNVVAANELDAHACETYRANHPHTKLFEGCFEQHALNLFKFKNIDVVFGGPPCQGFSVAGKMSVDDPRSELVFSFCTTVAQVQPKMFVMENVKSLATLSKFETVRVKIMDMFAEAGYVTEVMILNAKTFGVPQSRERAFFVGVKDGLKPPLLKHLNKHMKNAPTVRDILTLLGKPSLSTNQIASKSPIVPAKNPVLRRSPYSGMMFNGQGRPMNPDAPANTLVASMSGNRTPIIDDACLHDGVSPWVANYHQHLMRGGAPLPSTVNPSRLRRLTITEAALLQTFPPNYTFRGPNSKVYSQIGNAVPCLLANAVAEYVKTTLVES